MTVRPGAVLREPDEWDCSKAAMELLVSIDADNGLRVFDGLWKKPRKMLPLSRRAPVDAGATAQ